MERRRYIIIILDVSYIMGKPQNENEYDNYNIAVEIISLVCKIFQAMLYIYYHLVLLYHFL